MKPEDAQQAAEDAGRMATAWLGVALRERLTGRLAFVLVGEAVLPAARMDEEAHQAAARAV
jgi:hypothetical protein